MYRNSGTDTSGTQQARIPFLFNTDVDWILEEHLAGTSGVANTTYQNGCHFQVSWFEVDINDNKAKEHDKNKDEKKSVVLASNNSLTKKNLRLGRLYGGQPSQNLRQGAFTVSLLNCRTLFYCQSAVTFV